MAEEVALTPEQEDAAQEAAFQEQAAKSDARLSGEEPPDPDATKVAPEPAAGTPAPSSDTKPAAADGQQAAPAVEAPDAAILAKLPPDVRDAVKARLDALSGEVGKERNNNRSLAGRISAYQRKYEEAVGLKQPAAAKAATDEQKTEWKQFSDDYPDIAKSIEAKFAAEQKAANLDGIVDWIEGQKRERFLHDAFESVEVVHPGWRNVVNTKQFLDWKATSPTYEKLADSDEISDAVTLLDLYNALGPKASAPNQADVAAAKQLAARREAQVAGGQAAPSRAGQPNENVDLADPEQLFAFYANKSNQRIRNRYK